MTSNAIAGLGLLIFYHVQMLILGIMTQDEYVIKIVRPFALKRRLRVMIILIERSLRTIEKE